MFTSSGLSSHPINKGIVWSQRFILSLLLTGGGYKWLSSWWWYTAGGHVHPVVHPVTHPVTHPVASNISNNTNDGHIEGKGCRCYEIVLFHQVALLFSFYLIFYLAGSILSLRDNGIMVYHLH